MNIFELSNELQDIMNELEENGGELTPELEEQLSVNQENVNNKIKSYTQVIHQLESDIELVKNETKRLYDVRKSKEKAIENIKKLILFALDNFGTVNKSGTRCIDFGTGKVSTRRTDSVEVDDDTYNKIADAIRKEICWVGFTNNESSLDLSVSNIVNNILLNYKNGEGEGIAEPISATEDDIDALTLKFTIPVNAKHLMDDKYLEILKHLAKDTNKTLKVEADVNKSLIKVNQKADGNYNLSKLITKQNVIIK